MTRPFLLLALTLLLGIKLQAQPGTPALRYPDDFMLPAKEIPQGYDPLMINEEARQIGFTTNPGFISNHEFIRDLYEGIDPKTVEKVYVAMYRPRKNKDFETGYYVIAYQSVAALQKEQQKIKKYSGARYFIKDRYLLEVWGDSGSFEDAVTHISGYFKNKLGLTEFSPPERDNSDITTDVAAPAE